MQLAKRKKLPEYVTPQLTVGTLDLSGRTAPLSVPLNPERYNADGRYTLISWASITYPAGYTGAAAFNVTPPVQPPMALRSVEVVGNTLVAEIQSTMFVA